MRVQVSLSYKSDVELSDRWFSSLQISSQLPNPFHFLRISALRPGHPQAAGQGGGKVSVALLGLSAIPIQLDFAEVGNSSSAV